MNNWPWHDDDDDDDDVDNLLKQLLIRTYSSVNTKWTILCFFFFLIHSFPFIIIQSTFIWFTQIYLPIIHQKNHLKKWKKRKINEIPIDVQNDHDAKNTQNHYTIHDVERIYFCALAAISHYFDTISNKSKINSTHSNLTQLNSAQSNRKEKRKK